MFLDGLSEFSTNWGGAMAATATRTRADVQEIIELAKEAECVQKEWRHLLAEVFPEGSPVKFALKSSPEDLVTYHEGTASKHQAGEACDEIIVNVDPLTIPAGWHWNMSKGPCSCCGEFYFTIRLANVMFCLK